MNCPQSTCTMLICKREKLLKPEQNGEADAYEAS